MLKIKVCFITLAITGGVLGAVAHNSQLPCESQQQYYKWGNSYIPAGQYGVDYVCYSGVGTTCTYYLSNPFNPNSWAPCHTGGFMWLLK